MIHQNTKNIYYSLMYPISVMLLPFYKFHYRWFKKHIRMAHIGCGRDYMKGFINIDGNHQQKCDYVLDVRAGLPFPSDCMDFIYSCHMIEHLYPDEALKLIADIYRVLKRKGCAMVSMPDFHHAIRIYNGEQESQFPRLFKSPSAQAINYLFCDGQHRYAYSFELIREMAEEVGFCRVKRTAANDRDVSGEIHEEPVGSLSVCLLKC
jgi:predicted SAM-dependent methyltransferase